MRLTLEFTTSTGVMRLLSEFFKRNEETDADLEGYRNDECRQRCLRTRFETNRSKANFVIYAMDPAGRQVSDSNAPR